MSRQYSYIYVDKLKLFLLIFCAAQIMHNDWIIRIYILIDKW